MTILLLILLALLLLILWIAAPLITLVVSIFMWMLIANITIDLMSPNLLIGLATVLGMLACIGHKSDD